jgi:hypothetical protein
MLVLMIGGPLDGELREVKPDSADSAGKYTHVVGWHEESQEHTYHLSNGIARHESVSEEGVARRMYGATSHIAELNAQCLRLQTELSKAYETTNGWIAECERQRYMTPQGPPEIREMP